MHTDNRFKQILEGIPQPAIFVKNETIVYANRLAREFSFTEGIYVPDILESSIHSFRSKLREGIEIKMRLNGLFFTGRIHMIEDTDLIIIDHKTAGPELQVLQLASTKIRKPLFDLMNSVELICKQPTDETTKNMVSKYAHQLERHVINMDCAWKYHNKIFHPQKTDMRSFLNELLSKIKDNLDSSDILFQYNRLNELAICDLDRNMFTNALLNMITNSLEAGANNVSVEISALDNQLRISVTDDGKPVIQGLRFNMFNQFLREPAVQDNHIGLGLGMVIIHETAVAHNGSLFMDVCNVDETRFTMTIPYSDSKSELKQSRSILVEKFGGMDLVKVHLSEYLSPKEFKK